MTTDVALSEHPSVSAPIRPFRVTRTLLMVVWIRRIVTQIVTILEHPLDLHAPTSLLARDKSHVVPYWGL